MFFDAQKKFSYPTFALRRIRRRRVRSSRFRPKAAANRLEAGRRARVARCAFFDAAAPFVTALRQRPVVHRAARSHIGRGRRD